MCYGSEIKMKNGVFSHHVNYLLLTPGAITHSGDANERGHCTVAFVGNKRLGCSRGKTAVETRSRATSSLPAL